MNPFYPDKIGLAVDPTNECNLSLYLKSGQMATHERIYPYLADALLLFQTVVFAADAHGIIKLYQYFSTNDLKPLLNDKRLVFCLPGYDDSDILLTRQNLIGEQTREGLQWSEYLPKTLEFHAPSLRSSSVEITEQVLEYSLSPSIDEKKIDEIESKILDNFINEVDCNLPKPEGPYSDDMVHYWIFREHVQRMLSFWSRGVLPIHADLEFTSYLDSFKPKKDFLDSSLGHISLKTVEVLHSIENLPSLGAAVASNLLSRKDLIRLLQSDEIYYLRDWLRSNISPGMDVRDSYYGSLEKLPSKKKWVSWLRFGTTTTFGTAAGLFLSQVPVIAAALGLAAGVGDLLAGDKIAQKFDPYHPLHWISFLGGHIVNKKE